VQWSLGATHQLHHHVLWLVVAEFFDADIPDEVMESIDE
jgi:hypothetical protein